MPRQEVNTHYGRIDRIRDRAIRPVPAGACSRQVLYSGDVRFAPFLEAADLRDQLAGGRRDSAVNEAASYYVTHESVDVIAPQ